MPSEFFSRLKRHPNAWIRRGAGAALIVGGILGFLPILGFWMLPLGIVLISDDIPWLRRQRRRVQSWWLRRRRGPDDAKPVRQASDDAPVHGEKSELE